MKVTLEEIKQLFNELIQKKQSREYFSNWASIRQQSHEGDDLVFEPYSEKTKIWNAILYLMGVDLLDIDGSYLHSIEDFIDYQNKVKL